MDIAILTVLFLMSVIWLGVVAMGPPYVPTLTRDIRQLFDELKLTPSQRIVDLGAGDGRVLVMAAERGVKADGVEINPFLVAIARFRLRQHKGSVSLGDMWKYRLPDDTSHVFIFPAEVFMNKLERYVVEQRRHTGPLTVILYGFQFNNRVPDRSVGAFNLYTF